MFFNGSFGQKEDKKSSASVNRSETFSVSSSRVPMLRSSRAQVGKGQKKPVEPPKAPSNDASNEELRKYTRASIRHIKMKDRKKQLLQEKAEREAEEKKKAASNQDPILINLRQSRQRKESANKLKEEEENKNKKEEEKKRQEEEEKKRQEEEEKKRQEETEEVITEDDFLDIDVEVNDDEVDEMLPIVQQLLNGTISDDESDEDEELSNVEPQLSINKSANDALNGDTTKINNVEPQFSTNKPTNDALNAHTTEIGNAETQLSINKSANNALNADKPELKNVVPQTESVLDILQQKFADADNFESLKKLFVDFVIPEMTKMKESVESMETRLNESSLVLPISPGGPPPPAPPPPPPGALAITSNKLVIKRTGQKEAQKKKAAPGPSMGGGVCNDPPQTTELIFFSFHRLTLWQSCRRE